MICFRGFVRLLIKYYISTLPVRDGDLTLKKYWMFWQVPSFLTQHFSQNCWEKGWEIERKKTVMNVPKTFFLPCSLKNNYVGKFCRDKKLLSLSLL